MRDRREPAPLIQLPATSGPHPGVVLGAEAYGINPFILRVQADLNELRYATALPDYYHGAGPKNVEAYDDFAEVFEYMAALDFTCGARDLCASGCDRNRAHRVKALSDHVGAKISR